LEFGGEGRKVEGGGCGWRWRVGGVYRLVVVGGELLWWHFVIGVVTDVIL